MKQYRPVLLATICLILTVRVASGWGFWAHRVINNKAIATLPKGMQGFYSNYSDYITAHSVDPDKKRYCHMDEGARHFIDLDKYHVSPRDSMPRRWKDAVAMFTADTLAKYGSVPWYIYLQYYDLVQAFKKQDADAILRISSHLGHYVADSYVPLHATSNYDGQLTGQTGIHALWESAVPELLGGGYNYNVGKARFISSVSDFVWKGVFSSADEVDSTLTIEKELLQVLPLDQVYCYDINRSGQISMHYSETFVKIYNQKLNNMIERRMRGAISAVGDLWMSAWVEAGQPDLDRLIGKSTIDKDEKEEGE